MKGKSVQEQQAMSWYYAENRSRLKDEDLLSWTDLDDAYKERIRGRVQRVLEGEVLRSNMSPGDLAIYQGRYRFLEQSPPQSYLDLLSSEKPFNVGEQRVRASRTVWWDCLDFNSFLRPRTILFGAVNIGNFNLCNLSVPTSISHKGPTHLCGWHLTLANELAVARELERVFANAHCTILLEDMPGTSRRLLDLYREPQPLSITVPYKQDFRVSVEFFGDLTALQDKVQANDDPLRMWVNIEGWQAQVLY